MSTHDPTVRPEDQPENRAQDHSHDTLRRGSYREVLRVGEILRKETIGGLLLVVAALVAIVWANSPLTDSYFALRDFEVGYEPWHLRLSLGQWSSDGLLAVFFFLTGLELKREFVAGDLRRLSRAIVPVAAAFGGVLAASLANGGSLDDIGPGVDFFKQIKDAGNFNPVEITPATIQSGETPLALDWDYLIAWL